MRLSYVVFGLCLVGNVACGSEAAGPSDAGDDAAADAGADVVEDAGDFGAPSDTYPAFKPPVPQVVNSGGQVMPSVNVVPVFFPNDTLEAKSLEFLGKYAGSGEWTAMVSEYGVGASTLGTTVDIGTDPAASMSDTDIQTWLAAHLDGSDAAWGAVDADTLKKTLYVLYYPAATSISMGGSTSCNGFGGYHSEAVVANGKASYAVIPRCKGGLAALTVTTSHEMVEAATDPLPGSEAAYSSVAEADLAWAYFYYGGEIGDMCQTFQSSLYQPTDLGFNIQRSWSDKSAGGYHDPCVPIPPTAGPYFNTAPVQDDTVTVGAFGQTFNLRGTSIKLGETKTVELDLFSDAKTSGPWTVSVYDLQQLRGQAKSLDLSLDRTTGQNGEKVHLTITVVATTLFSAAAYQINSKLGTKETQWIGVVGIPQ